MKKIDIEKVSKKLQSLSDHVLNCLDEDIKKLDDCSMSKENNEVIKDDILPYPKG